MDHRVAGQAFERVEIGQVRSRLASHHGDAADQAMADAGALTCCQFSIRIVWTLDCSVAEYRPPDLIYINAGGRRAGAPRYRPAAATPIVAARFAHMI